MDYDVTVAAVWPVQPTAEDALNLTRLLCTSNTQHTVFAEDVLQFVVVHVLPEVLDVNVGELLGSGSKLSLTLFARFEATNKPTQAKKQ